MPVLTLAGLRTRVYNRIENNSLFYPTVTVDLRINQAIQNVNLFTGFNQARTGGGFSVANRLIYNCPPGVIFPMKIFLEGKELLKTPLQSMVQGARQILKPATGRAPSYWIPIGLRQYCIYPAPLGGKFIDIWGVTEPAKLVNPTDTMTLADEHANLVEDRAFITLTLKEGGKIFTDASKIYPKWLVRMKDLRMWEEFTNPKYWVDVKSDK